MQSTLNRLTSPVRSFAAGTWVALFALLALCLAANPAMAGGSSSPIVVTGTPVLLAPLTGGWDGSQEPIGGTFVIGVNGDVLIGDGYSSNVLQITPSGTPTTLASGVGAANATLDGYGNLYFGGNYNANLYKVPYNAATGQYVGWTTTPTTNCLGGNQDTSPCIFAPAVAAYVNTLGGQGYAGVVFDGQGNFYFETNTLPTTNPNTIFECNVACISSSSATPTVIYADSNPIGALAIDPWGNLFFIDGVDNTGKLSYLNEIPLSSGSYASTPTVLETYTSSAGNNGLSGLAISGNGTLFFITNNDGIFAIPNTQSGGPNPSGIYMVSTDGGKGVALDSQGNLYALPYDNTLGKDTVFFIPVGSFSLGASPKGTAATAVAATIFDGAASCTTPPTLALSATEFGVSTTEFTAAAGATCSTSFSGTNGVFSSGPLTAAAGSSFSVTANFTPTTVGNRNAVLTIKDSANSASGTTALAGVGQGAMANLDPGVWTSYTSGFSKPYSVSVDAAGDMAVADEGAKVFWIPAGSPAGTAPTSIGSNFVEPAATAFDANGNLYIADFSTDEVVEIPDVSGALAPASQSILIPATMVFDGLALSKPSGLAVGPDGRLYIADLGNSRVVSYDLITGQTAVPLAGLKNPWGIAVDPSNNLYVADTGNGNVLVDVAGAQTTLTVPGVSAPWGVVIDPSGSLIVSDHATGNIVWVPNVSGTLTTANSVMIEKNPSSALGIALDTLGNLYTTDVTAKAVYAIQRTAASLNFGTVQDGVPSNTETIYTEVTGNMPVTLGTPAFTTPTSSDFTLTSTLANNKCTGGSSGNPGQDCQIQSVFTPAVGTVAGPVSATATLSSNAPNLASATIYLTGTASLSSILAQTITGFNPSPTLQAGQQITLSATGGASGNPVVFSIDATSTCPSCATITGSVLTAVSVGSVKVDANQAGGPANGNQYAPATQVQVPITISNTVAPAGVPALLMTQVSFLNPTGSFTDGQTPAGGSIAVTQNGQVVVGTTYSNKVYVVNAQTGATVGAPVSVSGPGGITIDSSNNLYVSHLYNSVIYKIPFVKGAYVTWSDNPTPAPPACTGSDTVECTFVSYPSSPTPPNSGGLKAIAFDPSGNFYMVSEPSSSGAGQSYIYECNASCMPAGTGTLLYSDADGVSQIAFDPWGNLFFTDANYLESGSSNEGNSGAASSSLWEIPKAGVAAPPFTGTPTLLQAFTNAGTPGGYDDILASVTVNPTTGTIYYGLLYDGTYGIPNSQAGGPVIANQFAVSSQGAKAFASDSIGNIYVVANTGGADTVGVLFINDLTTPNAQYLGAPVTASATVVDNVLGCGTAPTLAFASSSPEFSATAGATCSSVAVSSGNGTLSTPIASASSYPATITFTATSPNTQTATLTASDTTNGGVGTATVTGLSLTTPQTLTFTTPTTTTYAYSPGMTIVVSVANGGSNNPAAFTVDSSSSGAGTFSATTVTGTTSSATLTVSQAGSIVIDANELGGLAGGTYYDAAPQVQLTLTIGKASDTITFSPPTSPVAYLPGITVNLSATGGGASTPVVFTVDASSTGAGTVSTTTVTGNTSSAILTVTQAGTIVLDANQAADTNFQAAPQVQQVLVVNQASQTIAFTPVTTPLYYIASCSVITQCGTIQIQATGGATNNQVAISPDSKNGVAFTILSSSVTNGITTTTLALVPNQTLPSPANLILDGNQQGNSNYAAATQATITIPVLSPLPLQTITWANPGTQVAAATLTLNATASSGLAVTYTSTTTSVCTVTGAKVTFAKVTSASACTITVSQPGDNKTFAAAVPLTQTFVINPTGQTPSLSMNLSLSSLTIEPGTIGLTQITLTSLNNFAASSIAFSCGGLPTGYNCTFNPNPVTVFAQSSTTGMPLGTTITTTLTITPPTTAAAVHKDFRPLFPATLAVALCFVGFKKRNRLYLLVLLVALFAGLGAVSGCGGTQSSSTKPPVTSTVTITATPAAGLAGASGAVTASAPLSITLE
jgi:sugar lactone lactonase YvrE